MLWSVPPLKFPGTVHVFNMFGGSLGSATTNEITRLVASGIGTRATLRGRDEGRSSKPEGLSRGWVLGEGR